MIGPNPTSQWLGSQGGFGPTSHFDVVLEPSGDGGRRQMRFNGAGGSQKVPGDYLYRTFMANGFAGGAWGLFRVGPEVPAGAEQRHRRRHLGTEVTNTARSVARRLGNLDPRLASPARNASRAG